jgi:hypothetical protein
MKVTGLKSWFVIMMLGRNRRYRGVNSNETPLAKTD